MEIKTRPKLPTPQVGYSGSGTSGTKEVEVKDASCNLAGKHFSAGARATKFDKLCVMWFAGEFHEQDNKGNVKMGGQSVKASDSKRLTKSLRKQLQEYKVCNRTIKSLDCVFASPPADYTLPAQPSRDQGNNDAQGGYCETCQNLFNRTFELLKTPKPALLFIVLRKKDIHFYPEIKRWEDCRMGIPTVCITANKLLQDNVKLRANIW